MLKILYTGNANGEYYQGVSDQVLSKAGYLVTLVNLGIVTSAAQLTLETQDSNAWKQTMFDFGDGPKNGIKNVLAYKTKMDKELFANTSVNVKRILHSHHGINLV